MSKNNIVVALVTLIVVLGVGYFFNMNGTDNLAVDEANQTNENVREFEISPGEVAQKIQNSENIVLLDVRTPAEHEAVRLENSLLLPVQELSAESLASIGLGEDAKDKEIIIYCRSGNRSEAAYNMMKSLGYRNIKSLAGGLVYWEVGNYPYTETGEYDFGASVI